MIGCPNRGATLGSGIIDGFSQDEKDCIEKITGLNHQAVAEIDDSKIHILNDYVDDF